MTRTISPPASSQTVKRPLAWMAAILFLTPVQAQAGAQFDVVGHVAPRCWVSNAALLPQPATQGSAICNQARPALQSRVRVLETPGTAQPLGPQLSARTALEIIVSPQL
ncbi:hypothetical protein TomMM35A_30780 [Sphingobium sp. TomMM35A]